MAVQVRRLKARVEKATDLRLYLGADLPQPKTLQNIGFDERAVRGRKAAVVADQSANPVERSNAAFSHKRQVNPNSQTRRARRDSHGVLERRAVGHEARATENSVMKRRLDPSIDHLAQAKVVGVRH